jgi:F0F1-type ATP synthase assembly protein I
MKLTFGVWWFKSHISAVAGALFSFSAHCRTLFSLFDEKDMLLMRQ